MFGFKWLDFLEICFYNLISGFFLLLFVSVFIMHKPSSFLVSLLLSSFCLGVLHRRPSVAFSSPFLSELQLSMEMMYKIKKTTTTQSYLLILSDISLCRHQISHHSGELQCQSLENPEHKTVGKKKNRSCVQKGRREEMRRAAVLNCPSCAFAGSVCEAAVRQLPSLAVM